MVTAIELTEAIKELGASVTRLGKMIGTLGNKELLEAYREHALKGFYHFCQECALITSGIELEDIE